MPERAFLSVVALLEDVADHGLLRGQVGTVVERLAPGVCDVESSDGDGWTYATLSLRGDQLLPLPHEPSDQAACADRCSPIQRTQGTVPPAFRAAPER